MTSLAIEEAEQFVRENRYLINQKNWFLSRCIDGRYQSTKDPDVLEPLAKPGADGGDWLTILAADREYDLRIKKEAIEKAILKTIGGVANFRFHTDSHAQEHGKDDIGCGHLKQASLDPDAYGMNKENQDFIFARLKSLKKRGAKEVILQGEHRERAVLIIKSALYSVLSMALLNGELIQVFVYHKTLDDQRRKILAKELFPNIKALYAVDEEYLYQILSQVADDQLLQTVTRLAKNLPIYEVKIDDSGELIIGSF